MFEAPTIADLAVRVGRLQVDVTRLRQCGPCRETLRCRCRSPSNVCGFSINSTNSTVYSIPQNSVEQLTPLELLAVLNEIVPDEVLRTRF